MITTRSSGIFLMAVPEAGPKISPSHDSHAKFELVVELKTQRPKFMKMVGAPPDQANTNASSRFSGINRTI